MWNDRHNTYRSKLLVRPGLRALLAMAIALPPLFGCGAAVVTGIAVGAAVLHDRRDRETVLEDEKIELEAAHLMIQHSDINQDCRISTTSYNLVVLLTGQCGKQASAERFAERISRVPKVKRVVDEVTAGPFASVARESEDVLLTSQAKFAVTQIDRSDFDATRVKVVTEAGIVYLMGLVTREEADAVVEKVRYVPGVKKVIKVFEYIQSESPATT